MGIATAETASVEHAKKSIHSDLQNTQKSISEMLEILYKKGLTTPVQAAILQSFSNQLAVNIRSMVAVSNAILEEQGVR